MINIVDKQDHFIALSADGQNIEIGKTVKEAYEKLKNKLPGDKTKSNNNYNIFSKSSPTQDNILDSLKLFFIKVFSLIFILLRVVFFFFSSVSESVYQNCEDFNTKISHKMGGSNFWGKIEREIISSSDEKNSISKEKQEQILNAIKIHVNNLKPFYLEINKLFKLD